MRQKRWHRKREICETSSPWCLPHHVKHPLSTVGAHLSENLKWPCGFYQRLCFRFNRNEEALKQKMMLEVQSITENKNVSAEALWLDVWWSWPTAKGLVLVGAPGSFSSTSIEFAAFSAEDFVLLLLSLCCTYRSKFLIRRFHYHGNTVYIA